MTTEHTNSKVHYYGIDILRLIFVYAIIHYHTYETFFFNDKYILRYEDSIYTRLEYMIRALAFSGFALVTLSSFLLGWVNMSGKKWFSLIGVFALGTYLLAVVEGDGLLAPYLEWDIYAFHAISFAFLFVIKKQPRILYTLGILSLPMLFYPFWNFEHLFPVGLTRDILVGDCSVIKNGAWPLLPWIAIPMTMFSLAHFIKHHGTLKNMFHRGSKIEFGIWVVIVIGLMPWIDGYFYTDIGPGFGCYTHRRAPIHFWSQWVCVLFLMRLSFLERVNDFLKKYALVKTLSGLQWSRNIGLAYALHFIFLDVGYALSQTYLAHHYLLDVFFITMVVGVEILCRLFKKGFIFLSGWLRAHVFANF